jgi:abortive infection alpha-like protein
MADEDKLVKAGVEAALKPFADLLEKLAGPTAEEIGLTFKDHVRVFRLKRQLRLFQRTKEMLQEAGIEPKHVSLKILGPIVESASLEENDSLQDKWAALLATAASADEDEQVHPSFVEVLKQLSALDSQFLDCIFSKRHQKGPRGQGKVYDQEVIEAMFPELIEVKDRDVHRLHVSAIRKQFEVSGLHVNLERLGLVKIERIKEVFWYEITRFGKVFVGACESPKKAQTSKAQSARMKSSSE